MGLRINEYMLMTSPRQRRKAKKVKIDRWTTEEVNNFHYPGTVIHNENQTQMAIRIEFNQDAELTSPTLNF